MTKGQMRDEDPTPSQDIWLSIVVPSYNQAEFLEATLRSLLNQREPGMEIIVVDGGSTDGSAEILRRYSDRLASWVSEPDRGQSHALNKGFAKAKGRWLGWLNSDDLLLPGAVQALREAIAADPGPRWWIGGGHFIDDHGKRFHDYTAPMGLTAPEQLADWAEYWFAQPSTFFTRELFEEAGGGIDEDLHYAMDLDLWLRFLKICPPATIPADLSVYRYHIDGKTRSMAAVGEVEIIAVLLANIGEKHALQRVRRLAAEREDLRARCRRYERVLRPLIIPYSLIKRTWLKARNIIGPREVR